MLRLLLPVLLVAAVVIVIAVLAGRRRPALPPDAQAGPPQLPPGLAAPRALPGWYPDPEAAGRQRWWDGVAWTLDTRDDPQG